MIGVIGLYYCDLFVGYYFVIILIDYGVLYCSFRESQRGICSNAIWLFKAFIYPRRSNSVLCCDVTMALLTTSLSRLRRLRLKNDAPAPQMAH